MKWNVIAQSTAGTSHVAKGKDCEDAVAYNIIKTPQGDEVLLCCASDGAGSAKFAAEASQLVTATILSMLEDMVIAGNEITEAALLGVFEMVYDIFSVKAGERGEDINEFSCTLLGCVVYTNKTIFFHTGDGAVVRDDGNGCLVTVWWPQNGEYSNTTSFFTDDPSFYGIRIRIALEVVNEVAIFTDGLQTLVLDNEAMTVHQPFFTGMFKWLRKAHTDLEINLLQTKLEQYLGSALINNRTDDDKTLLLATRLNNE